MPDCILTQLQPFCSRSGEDIEDDAESELGSTASTEKPRTGE